MSIAMNEEAIGYPIYRMNEIHNMLCDFTVNKHADVSAKEAMPFILNDKDVLFNRTNSFEWVGRTGIYRKKSDENFIFASYLVRFVPKEEKLTPEYLATFLSCQYGIQDIRRRARQSINQTNVNPEEIKQINIPIFSMSFQKKVTFNFDTSYELLVLSEEVYSKAEGLLCQELDLDNFQSNKISINVKSLKNSFLTTGRLDAEYYQPKFDEYNDLIKNYQGGYGELSKVCTLKGKNFNPEDNKTYDYIELSNIGSTGRVEGTTIDLGENLPSRARRKVAKGDVIISSIEGSLSSCALIGEDHTSALCSTGFYVINSKNINSETLLILFKSELMQSMLKRNCSGTILTAINKDEFLTLPMPIIRIETQEKIANLVQKSFILKSQSEKLLEDARKLVETAIEEGEDRAMRNYELGLLT